MGSTCIVSAIKHDEISFFGALEYLENQRPKSMVFPLSFYPATASFIFILMDACTETSDNICKY